MYRVYIDVIFAVNLFMDLAVLAMLNRLFSYRADLKHMIRGAVLGAVWACVLAVFPETPLLLQMFGTYVAVGSLMAVTAYGIRSRKELIRAVGGIYLISVVLGGVMLALSESSLGREVANWMPGRFSIRFFWQQELLFLLLGRRSFKDHRKQKNGAEISAECHIAL